jgi:cytidylate kinase
MLTKAHTRTESDLVEEAFRHWDARRLAVAAEPGVTPPPSRPLTVALAREVGIQATAIANEVGKRLGWPVYDYQLLERIAGEMGLRTALLESIDERRQGWLRNTIGASLASLVSGGAVPWVRESSYVHHLVEVVHALGAHGECVIVGRGSAFILPPESTLRVFLVGPVRERIRALAPTLHISEHDAALRIRTLDRERNDFIREHFRKDPTDPDNYDIAVNAIRLSAARAASVIVTALECLKDSQREWGTTAPAAAVGGAARG